MLLILHCNQVLTKFTARCFVQSWLNWNIPQSDVLRWHLKWNLFFFSWNRAHIIWHSRSIYWDLDSEFCAQDKSCACCYCPKCKSAWWRLHAGLQITCCFISPCSITPQWLRGTVKYTQGNWMPSLSRALLCVQERHTLVWDSIPCFISLYSVCSR